MRRHRAIYRTKDGAADYLFSFEEQRDGSWRAYIERQPSYCDRMTAGYATHRVWEKNRMYVDWAEPFRTLDQAKRVAAYWADRTQEYIRTGR